MLGGPELCAAFFEEAGLDEQFPSWVPRWSMLDTPFIWFLHSNHLSSSADSKPGINFHEDPNTLSVQGLQYDSVERIETCIYRAVEEFWPRETKRTLRLRNKLVFPAVIETFQSLTRKSTIHWGSEQEIGRAHV